MKSYAQENERLQIDVHTIFVVYIRCVLHLYMSLQLIWSITQNQVFNLNIK